MNQAQLTACVASLLSASGALASPERVPAPGGDGTPWARAHAVHHSPHDAAVMVPDWREAEASARGTRTVPGGAPWAQVEVLANGDGTEVDMPADVLFSQDGQDVLVVSHGIGGDANISVYDAGTLALGGVFPLSHDPECAANIPGTTRILLTNPGDDSVTVFDYATGTEVATIPVCESPSWVLVSSDGSFALTASARFTPEPDIAWSRIDLTTMTETDRFMGGPAGEPNIVFGTFGLTQDYVHAHFSPDEQTVYTMTAGGDIRVLDLTTLTWSTPFTVEVDGYWGIDFALSPDGSTIALMTNDFFTFQVSVLLIDVATWTSTSAVLSEFDFLFGVPLFSPDSTKVVAPGFSSLHMVEVTEGSATTLDTSSYAYFDLYLPVATVDGGTKFAMSGLGSLADPLPMVTYDWATGALVAETTLPALASGDSFFTPHFAFSPTDDTVVAVVDGIGVLEEVAVVDLDPAGAPGVHAELGDGLEGDRAFDMGVSADGSCAMLVNFNSGNAVFIDTETGVREWVDVGMRPYCAELTPDGRCALFTQLDQNIIRVYDRDTATMTDLTLNTPDERAYMLTLDRDGDHAYVMVDTQGASLTELRRIDLATKTLDPVALPLDGYNAIAAPLTTGIVPNAPVVLDDPNRDVSQSADGSTLIVNHQANDASSGRVTFVDLAAWSVVGDASAGNVPTRQSVFSPDDAFVYQLGTGEFSFVTFKTTYSVHKMTNAGAASAIVGTVTFASDVTHVGTMALSPDGSKLYVSVRLEQFNPGGFATDSIRVIDTASFTQVASVSVPVVDDFEGEFAPGRGLHPNEPMHLRFSDDGRSLWVFCLSGETHRIDTATDAIAQSYTTGLRGVCDVWADPTSPAGTARFLVGGSSFVHTSDNNWDGIAEVSFRLCPADIAIDGDLSSDDIFAFVQAFLSQEPDGDMDGNGSFEPNDIDLFVSQFVSGCA